MADTREVLEVRKNYIQLVKNELLGPGSEISVPDAEHELISSSPDGRYSIGILFPQKSRREAGNNEIEQKTEEETDSEVEAESAGNGETTVKADNDSDLETDEEEGLDEEVSLASQNMPSSFGLSFLVEGECDHLTCDLKFGTYHAARPSECRMPLDLKRPEALRIPQLLAAHVYYDNEEKALRLRDNELSGKLIAGERKTFVGQEDDEIDIFSPIYKLNDQLQHGFVRDPHHCEITLDFTDGDFTDTGDSEIDGFKAKLTGLRRKCPDGLWSVTVMLLNMNEGEIRGNSHIRKAVDNKDRTLPGIFQPVLKISTENNTFVFKEIGKSTNFSSLDPEEKSLELQYRNKLTYGTGLGAAVSWNLDAEGRGSLFTDFCPLSEVPSMDFGLPSGYDICSEALGMKYLSDLNKEPMDKKIEKLHTIVDAYALWIHQRQEEIPNLPPVYSEPAVTNMAGCAEACRRMREGLEILRSDETAAKAFELANRAMYMQRAHLKLQEKTMTPQRFENDEELTLLLNRLEDDGYEKADSFLDDYYSWRLFQIAFLLMSVGSVVSDTAPDRKLVDLIWFPTGGGKTEAYLGLTAFTIFYRRMKYPDCSDGTSVIMRYTLRLLTAQQFTRASTLICACEYIRQDAISPRPEYGRYPLGKNPITIGLWIGGNHTPNKNSEAKKYIGKLDKANYSELKYIKESNNKFQVLKCPWCGTRMTKEIVDKKIKGSWGYAMKNNAHFVLKCPQPSCFFYTVGKLPVQVVDEELYLDPPTLLFGTVDKFAMLPWRKEIGNFFGIGMKNRSPELIIQDELHLISGPLGTMVGLYETAIDALCSEKGGSTKIIASTATIRRAGEQCAALYNRDVAQFPHPALDSDDSFFARAKEINYEKNNFGRIYVGLMASGKTKAMMQARSIAAMMQRIHTMDLPDDVKDKYWTLTAYFSSLKELGKCSTLVDDDIKDAIRRMARRTCNPGKVRSIPFADELTSRVSTTQLNETLDKLEHIAYSKENIDMKRYASNILLATNMISVGIDVSRLNVMFMVGQPKLTSEYIQASSRVGRSDPGVVFVMYDSSRSRDRSHYEQFKSYHESFYKKVEPTGATPFSGPARERALHAIVIAIMRITEAELRNEKDAGKFDLSSFRQKADKITDTILSRYMDINARVSPDAENESEVIRNQIAEILDRWSQNARNAENELCYGESGLVLQSENTGKRLLKTFNTKSRDGENPFDTMTSMRNVGGSVSANVRIWED